MARAFNRIFNRYFLARLITSVIASLVIVGVIRFTRSWGDDSDSFKKEAEVTTKVSAEADKTETSSDDDDEPLTVVGYTVFGPRINVSLSDGTYRTERDGTILLVERNFVDLSDLGRVWLKPKPFDSESIDSAPVSVDDSQVFEESGFAFSQSDGSDTPFSESKSRDDYFGIDIPKFGE